MTETGATPNVERWGIYELALPGPQEGNPFLDVAVRRALSLRPPCGRGRRLLRRRRRLPRALHARRPGHVAVRHREQPRGARRDQRRVHLRARHPPATTGRWDCATSTTLPTPTGRPTFPWARPATSGSTRATSWRSRRSRRWPQRRSTRCACASFPRTTPTTRTSRRIIPSPARLAGLGFDALRPRLLPAPRTARRRPAGPGHRGRYHPLPSLRPLGLFHDGCRDGRPLPALPGRAAGGLPQRLVVDGQRV